MPNKPLNCTIPFQFKLVESAGALPIVRGVFQKYDVLNANNRIYRKSIWENQLKPTSPLMNRVKSRKCLGLLEHPEDGFTRLDRSPSHLILSLRDDGKGSVIGEAQILSTRNGKELLALFRDNVVLGVSSRGNGSTTETRDGHDDVNDDYLCETFDFVFNNSVEDANPEPVNTEAFAESGKIKEDIAPKQIEAKSTNESPIPAAAPASPEAAKPAVEPKEEKKTSILKEDCMSKLVELRAIETSIIRLGQTLKGDLSSSDRAAVVESLRSHRCDVDKAMSEDVSVAHYAGDLQKKISEAIEANDTAANSKLTEAEKKVKELGEQLAQATEKLAISEQIVKKLVERYKALKVEVSAGSNPKGKNEAKGEDGKFQAKYETLRKITEEIIRRYKSLKAMSESAKSKFTESEKKAVHEGKRYTVAKKLIEGLVKRFKALNESIKGTPPVKPAEGAAPAAPTPAANPVKPANEGKKDEVKPPVNEAGKEPLPGQAAGGKDASKDELHECVGMVRRARRNK